MRTFKLRRLVDVSGVSGTGIIAEGIEFHDGQVVVSWLGQHHTLEIAPNIQDVMAIHGHQGRTVLEWDQFQAASCYRTRKIMKYIRRAHVLVEQMAKEKGRL